MCIASDIITDRQMAEIVLAEKDTTFFSLWAHSLFFFFLSLMVILILWTFLVQRALQFALSD